MTLYPPLGSSPLAIVMEGQGSIGVNGDQYLLQIMRRETVDTGVNSPVRSVMSVLGPHIAKWGNKYLAGFAPSGSFAKGTAVYSGTDIDLFLSLRAEMPDSLRDIYQSLFNAMGRANFQPKKQNVSINVKVGTYDVDLVPGQRQNDLTGDHSLYRRKKDSWTKTNVQKHIATVRAGGRLMETRIIKLWRNQKTLDFPSFYIELTVIEALRYCPLTTLSGRVRMVLEYLRNSFPDARVEDPANTNNVISDDLTQAEKNTVKSAAIRALNGTWEEFVQ
jgi:hypothetical protein